MSRDALIIGINRYDREALDGLTVPSKDAERVAQMLDQHSAFRITRLPEYTDANGNRKVGKQTKVTVDDLRTAITHLFTPDGDNIPEAALLYFSGHGLRENEQGYLATSDTDPNNAAPDQGIYGFPLQELRSLLEASPVKQQIVWLDCCHGGALLDFAAVDPGTQGGRDRCLITASREFEAAYINHEGNSSVLTATLLTALDPTKKPVGKVYAAGLVDEVQAALANEPQVTLGHVTGDRRRQTSLYQPGLFHSKNLLKDIET
ncbi:MAG: caspase family protein [Elainellaceae cyanobacterium]